MLRLRRARADQDAPWGLAWRRAFGQRVAWGVPYYAFTVVVGPMQAATGWSRTFLHATAMLMGPTQVAGRIALVELFGRERYSVASGALALPSILARAAAPWLLAAT